jgi:uncharacterized membrane protein YbhN (UPF0104 family)
MRIEAQQWWRVGKVLLGLAIVAALAWQFFSILKDAAVRQRLEEARPEWLAACAALYVVGLGFWGGFWFVVLRVLGERPAVPMLLRAYFASHLGKYVPGKAWALFLRTTIANAGGVRLGVAAMTSVYETLTTMAAGAILGVALLSSVALEDRNALWSGVIVLVMIAIPLLPPVFNPLSDRLTSLARRAMRQQEGESQTAAIPPINHPVLLGGLLMTSLGWWVLGLSLWAMLQAVASHAIPWTWESWLRFTGYIALAYVAGFVTFFVPGGLGSREVILQSFLAREFATSLPLEEDRALAWGVAILLRLLWIVAEVIMAAVAYVLSSPLVFGARPRTTDHGPTV